ncbi:SusC/RagA family TonB-linked outer membrane protein [Flavitalea flava]
MRITILQITLAAIFTSTLYAHKLPAQGVLEKPVTILAKHLEIRKVIGKVEKQTGVRFIYSSSTIEAGRKISCSANGKKLSQFMEEFLVPQHIGYKVIDDQILLYPLTPASPSSGNDNDGGNNSSSPFKPQKIISGTVTNDKGEPLSGVSIGIKGTALGTTTDAKGNFHLQIDQDNAILLVSYTGFRIQELPVGAKTVLVIRMAPLDNRLDDVVVIGYGSARKKDLTGAISTLKGDDLNVSPVASTTNTLGGRIPGLQSIQGSGEPGADAARLSIRGFGTALIIVDGVEQDFNNINPSEIESISVLKDASAAIYGARSGNGVILVTTKKGKTGKPVIAFNSNYTLQQFIALPKVVNSGQYAEIMREFDINSGINPNQAAYSEDQIKKYYAGDDPDYPNTDWWDAAMKKRAPIYKNDISVRGGNEMVKYYTYAGVMKQYGLARSNDNVYNRYNVRSNLEANVSKNLSMEMNLSAIIDDQTRSNAGIEEYGGFWNDYYWSLPTASPSLPDNTKAPYAGSATVGNPIVDTRSGISGFNRTNDQNIRGSLALNYKIPAIEGLTLRGFLDYQSNLNESKKFNRHFETFSYSYANKTYTPGLVTGPTNLSEAENRYTQLTRQLSLNYTGNINGVHTISAFVLYEGIDIKSKGFWAYRQNFLTPNIPYLFAGDPASQTNSGSATESSRASVAGRINYAFKDRYLLQATLRYDGSPNFPPSTRWGLFPSFSAAWRISQENFMRHSGLVNDLKLRLSYSNTGYDNVGNFQYIAGYTLGQRPWSVNGNTQTGISLSGIANPNITWENIYTYNGGVDFTMLKSALYGTADVFYRLRSGILGTRAISLPSTFGATLPYENINSYSDRGFEFSVGYRKSNNRFSYDISANVSYSRAKWKHYDETDYTDADAIKIQKVTGKWTDLVWGYQTDGLFTSQKEIDDLTYVLDGNANKSIHPGDIKYIDLNGDGVIDWKDSRVIGKGGLPKVMFGLNFRLEYRNFDLVGLLQGATGRSLNVSQGIDSRRAPSVYLFENRWTAENNNKHALYPRQGATPSNSYGSDYWLKDASYLRLKELGLGYNFTRLVKGKTGINNLRFYLSATNLFTISKLLDLGVDPEVLGETYSKVPGAVYPKQKTFSAGINLSF